MVEKWFDRSFFNQSLEKEASLSRDTEMTTVEYIGTCYEPFKWVDVYCPALTSVTTPKFLIFFLIFGKALKIFAHFNIKISLFLCFLPFSMLPLKWCAQMRWQIAHVIKESNDNQKMETNNVSQLVKREGERVNKVLVRDINRGRE